MTHDIALRTRIAAEVGQHFRGPAAVAAIGLNCAHQLRTVAPLVLLSISRVLPQANEAPCSACETGEQPPRLAFHEWDQGRWFVVDERLGMLGEIELVGTCYRVSFASDANGAVFGFESLQSAVSYFEEYVSATAQ